jgi:H+/Cl- antiporter ClcA
MKKLINALRTRMKRGYDRLHNERFKNNLLQAIPFWIASVITGLIAVLYAKLFSWAEMGTEWVLHHGVWWLFIVTPLSFVFAWWLVFKFAPGARGSGIPQVIAAVELAATPKYNDKVQKLLSVRIIFFKIVSSIVMVFGGGVVGREGPTIQIAGSVFRAINQLLPSWWPKISKRNMINAGAAAGLAAAFNTPLGGVVFAMEEVTRTHISYFKTALFTAVIIAGLTAQGLLGPYLYLGYPDVSDLSGYIFFGVIAVGIVTGVLGSGMAKVILSIMKWVRSFTISKRVIYITICALLLATMAFFISVRALGSGKEIMTHALFTADKHLPWYMPIVRVVGSVISFTTGAAGGVFAPALTSGASIGAVMAEWFNVSETNVNLLILAGMVGFLTGVTRTPFTSAILVLEMTDRHNVIFHLMLAGMVASMVAYLIDRHSFYDHLKMQFIHDVHHEAIPVVEEENVEKKVTS